MSDDLVTEYAGDGTWSEESEWDYADLEADGEGEAHIAVPTLAVVGRPNVGKSTLVNRIIGRREAVVEDIPGVTRDRVSYEANWAGRRFLVQDTGGWEPDAKGLQQAVARQAELAMGTADAILLVVDAVVGATATDEAVARVLRRSKTPVILVANKVDDGRTESEVAALWSLGLGQPYSVSATHGRGTGDLLDEVLEKLPETPREGIPGGGPRRVALVGKPNVGKSSLLNKLSGDERSVVHNVAGTTVDPVDSIVELGGRPWRFVDTAGLRKRVSHASGAEFYASLRTKSAIEAAEVAILLIDAHEPITEQDLRVLSMVADTGRALVIAFNKWDLVDEDRPTHAGQGSGPRSGPRSVGSASQHLRPHRSRRGEARAGSRHGSGVLGQARPHGSPEHLAQGSCGSNAASDAWWSPSAHHVRDAGKHAPADIRSLHHGLPRGRLPPLHRAASA